MVRSLILALVLFASTSYVMGQSLSVSLDVDPGKDTLSISPFIYGSNGQSSDWEANVTARRLGGNRMTGYNWENNASNMGTDYDASNSNDDYMTWVMGIPAAKENVPGISLSAFHDTSIAMGCYTLITLPAAGYVSRDKDGSVSQAQQAPSGRWRQVRFAKGSPLIINPDTSDGWVSVDEEVNFLVNRYGSASSTRGVRGYAVDNEPALWSGTHPRIHHLQPTIAEILVKNVALAKAVKNVDPASEIFGAVTYGFNEMYNFQNAPDWSTYQKYGRYVNAFLSITHDSSVAAGKRLIDAIDLHWYPDLNIPVALNDNIDSASVAARLHAPRSLWDSSYVEDGWIGRWYSPIALLPSMQTSIRKYNPGTKLAITEFNYGGSQHISGGLAIVDVLGLFGRYGVYFGSHWGAIEGYVQSAYMLFRNYDGKKGLFGDLSVHAGTIDKENSSVYAATEKGDPSRLHVIVLNKNVVKPLSASVTIAGQRQFQSATVYGFDGTSAVVRFFPGVASIANNGFSYTIPPLTVCHFVITSAPTSVAETPDLPTKFALEQNYPNPFNPSTIIKYSVGVAGEAGSGDWGSGSSDRDSRSRQTARPELGARKISLVVYDVLGRKVATLVDDLKAPGSYEVPFDGKSLSSGVYYFRLSTGVFSQTRVMMLLK